MVQIAKLSADLLANTSRYEEGMKRAGSVTKSTRTLITGELQIIGRGFAAFESQIISVTSLLGAGLSVTKVLSDLHGVITEMDNIGKAADRLTISTESMSKLAYAAKQTEVDFGALEVGIRHMQQAMVDAFKSGGKSQVFQDLKLNVRDLIQLKPEDALLKIADGFKNIQNPAQRSTDYIALFGKQGAIMANLLKNGSGALRQLMSDAEELGQVFGKKAAQRAEEFNSALTTLNSSYKGLMISFVSTGGIDKVTDLIHFLAVNMGTLAKAAELLSIIMIGRLSGALAATIAGWVTNTIAANAYAIAMARVEFLALQLTGTSAVAAAGITAMGVAGGFFARSLALIGGPWGLAAIAVVAALTMHTSDAEAANDKFQQTLQKVRDIQTEISGKQIKSIEQLKEEKQAALDDAKAQLKLAEALAERQKWYSLMTQGAANALNKSGIPAVATNADTELAKQKADFEKLQKEIADMEKKGSGGGGGLSGLTGNNDLAVEKAKQERLLADQSIKTEMQKNDQMLALDQESNRQYLQSKMDLQDQLDRIELAAAIKERDAVANDAVAFEKAKTKVLEIEQKQADGRLAIHTQLMQEIKKDELQLGQDINNELVDNLTDFTDGTKSAKDAFKSFSNSVLNDLARMASKNFVQSVFGGFTGSSGSGGGFGGSIASLFAAILPSFAVGTSYVPNDMIANIHKGERILTADENRAFSSGVGGGSSVVVNVINNSSSKVSTQATEGSNGTELNVMVDQMVSDNLSRPGSKSNQSLKKFNQRTLVRR